MTRNLSVQKTYYFAGKKQFNGHTAQNQNLSSLLFSGRIGDLSGESGVNFLGAQRFKLVSNLMGLELTCTNLRSSVVRILVSSGAEGLMVKCD